MHKTTLTEFLSMDDQAKAELTWRGTHIGEREKNGRKVLLYSLDRIYVEVIYDQADNKIMAFKAFSTLAEVAPYLRQAFNDPLV